MKEELWPFATMYAAKQREHTQIREALGEEALMKFGTKIAVKKRASRNRRIKGFEGVGLVGRYLGPIPETTEGHYVLVDNKGEEKMMKTTRVVPYNERENEEEDQDLKSIGWNWTTDPDGNMFFFNKELNEKSWTTPLRVEEMFEEPEDESKDKEERRRLHGKQKPPKYYLKTMNIGRR